MLERENTKFLVQMNCYQNLNLLHELHGKDGADMTSVHDGRLEG
jgi:hypothetical protein